MHQQCSEGWQWTKWDGEEWLAADTFLWWQPAQDFGEWWQLQMRQHSTEPFVWQVGGAAYQAAKAVWEELKGAAT
jgi:hypothetical protein